jgi:hypothetical protein
MAATNITGMDTAIHTGMATITNASMTMTGTIVIGIVTKDMSANVTIRIIRHLDQSNGSIVPQRSVKEESAMKRVIAGLNRNLPRQEAKDGPIS